MYSTQSFRIFFVALSYLTLLRSLRIVATFFSDGPALLVDFRLLSSIVERLQIKQVDGEFSVS